MNEAELKVYAKGFLREYAHPYVFKLVNETEVENLPNSTTHKAWNGISWIDYWRSFTGYYANQLSCACCGKDLFVNVENPFCKELVRMRQIAGKKDATVDLYQAEGAHIVYSSEAEDEYYDGVYIVPLCKKCNSISKQKFRLKAGSIICSELGYTIE